MPAKKRAPRPVGRPSLMTPETVKRITDAVQAGAPRHQAAAFAGIATSTLHNWLARGHAGEPHYKEFLEGIQQAEGVRVVNAAAKISTSGHWQAQAWLLERWDPAFRRPPDQVELANPDGSLRPIGVVAAGGDAVRLIRELRDLELAAGSDRIASPVRQISE
jgi:hypothetical protein